MIILLILHLHQVSDKSVRPKATRGRPRKSQPKSITSGPEIVTVDMSFDADSNVRSGSQILGIAIDNFLFNTYLNYIILSLIVDSSSTFVHPRGKRIVNINSNKRKSEVVNSGSVLEYKSSKKKSSLDSFGACRERRERLRLISDFRFLSLRITTQNFTAIGI